MKFKEIYTILQEEYKQKSVTLKKDFKGFPKGSKGLIISDFKGIGRYEISFPIDGKEINGRKKLVFVGKDIEEYLEF